MPIGDPGILAIRIVRGDTVFHVHGENAGAEGVWLAAGQVHGIYEAPVKTTWKTGAFQEGSWQKATKWEHRDITLGFHIRDTFSEYELNESLFRQIWAYELDPWEVDPIPTTIEVETNLSGVRKLDVLMYEAPTFDPDLDPMVNQYGNHIFKLRAGQPFWYQDDYTDTMQSTSTLAEGGVTAVNPTDRIAYQKFVLTRGTWTLPDVQWVGSPGARVPGGPNYNRALSGIIVTDTNGGAVADLDRQELMFRDANDTNILAQLAGKFFNYAIPPYTPPTTLPVSYTAAPAGGAMVQLVVPQRWTRPWGMERITDPTSRPPFKLIFLSNGNFAIPDWCDAIDVVPVGGGSGGQYGSTATTGHGGSPGMFVPTTLIRGIDIPWETTILTIQIGVGGIGGKPAVPAWWFFDPPTPAVPATDGTATTVVFLQSDGSTSTLSAAGGAAAGNTTTTGAGAGSADFNGETYVGGGDATSPSQPGNEPGGGGAGGYVNSAGGNGGRGRVWIRVYQAGS
jgi:hypothetical protein